MFAQMSKAVPELATGLMATLELTITAAIISFLFGHVIWWLREQRFLLLRSAARLYVSLMRGTPSIVQLFLVFFSLPLIGLGGKPLLAAILAIGLNSAAYTAEILRANYAAVPRGQREAARVSGLTRFQCWRYVLAPQALRGSLPALVNEFTLIVKTTPLASVIAVTELTYAGQLIIARTYEATPVMLPIVLGYLLICWPILLLARRLQTRLDRARAN
ncbi:amino acid ABC transporter permease [Phytopseudomonas punonensis]|uniref:Polar amino acid transport system permease protein n=1 Tax=Phytopseudomonas punonensis TaxID=1220495 RepID=A0A1M7FNH3_9GAMM|nr:amino acid ABC transporter permease [Pseudomonas punonensis]SHM05536.1 polar amino acid transport system permease protein [Pseudomonas punonensis]